MTIPGLILIGGSIEFHFFALLFCSAKLIHKDAQTEIPPYYCVDVNIFY